MTGVQMKAGTLPKIYESIFTIYSLIVYLQITALLFLPISLSHKFFISILIVYFQSPLIWRVLNILYGPTPNISYIGKKTPYGNLWYIGNKLQEIYETFEFLERILKTIPGFYSFWLRLWGAKIGQKVNWTPGCKIVDRPHINIGDRCLIGNMSYLSAHAIKKKKDKYILFIKDINIANNVVISYSSTIAPGVKIEAGAFIESGAVIYPNEVIKKGQTHERFKELLNKRFDFLFQRD